VFDGVVAGVVLETIVVTEVVDVVVWGGVVADVAVEHEAKSIDASSKQVNPVQIAFLFIHSSFFFVRTIEKTDCKRHFRILESKQVA
jgi:hypothetical protein